MKQPITMHCNESQFNEIKEKLKGKVNLTMLSDFNSNERFYLINHLCEEQNTVTNVVNPIRREGVIFYEEWNEKIFLEACGIETEDAKDIILEKVKEYFKNAKTVRCLYNLKEASIIDNITSEIYGDNKDFWINSSTHDGEGILLYENGKYAEILTYKEKTFSITESQINELSNTMNVCDKLKEWYPEAFESEVKLEAGKWYKETVSFIGKMFVYIESIQDNNNVTCYGFNGRGEWFDSISGFGTHGLELSTEQEVFEALKNEAVKRGFVEGAYFNGISDNGDKRHLKCIFGGTFTLYNNILSVNTPKEYWETNQSNPHIFKNGKWAEVLETITLSEAEQQLGKKIIV